MGGAGHSDNLKSRTLPDESRVDYENGNGLIQSVTVAGVGRLSKTAGSVSQIQPNE